jgi:hypothetical protein
VYGALCPNITVAVANVKVRTENLVLKVAIFKGTTLNDAFESTENFRQ